MYHGYANKILQINFTAGKVVKEELDGLGERG